MPDHFKLDLVNENSTSDSDSDNLMIDEQATDEDEELSRSDVNDYIDSEAFEVSGELTPSSDENDIKDNGEYLGSEDTEEDHSEESDEHDSNDSFVDDGPIVNELLSGTGDDLSFGNESDSDLDQSLIKKQKYNLKHRRSRILSVSESSSDDENVKRRPKSVTKKLNNSSSPDTKEPKLRKFEGMSMLKIEDESNTKSQEKIVSKGNKDDNSSESENNDKLKDSNTKNGDQEIRFSSDDTSSSNTSDMEPRSFSKNKKLTKFMGTSSLNMNEKDKNKLNRKDREKESKNNCTETEIPLSFQKLDESVNDIDKIQMMEIDEENVSSNSCKNDSLVDNTKKSRKKLKRKTRKPLEPKDISTSPDMDTVNDSYLEIARKRRLKKKLENRKFDDSEDNIENEMKSENQDDVLDTSAESNKNAAVELSKERKLLRLNGNSRNSEKTSPEGTSINRSLEKRERTKKRHRSNSGSDDLSQKKTKKRKKITSSGHFTVEKLSEIIRPSTKGSTNFKNEMLYSSRIKRESSAAFLRKQSKLD